MGSYFEGARGRMGETDFFVTSMRLGELARNIGYAERELAEGAEMAPDLLRQRKLNISRVRQEMVPYLIDREDHFFSAITVEVIRPGEEEHRINFIANHENPDFGRIYFDGTETLQAVDGQHRLKAIQLALQSAPELAKESIAVVFVPHQSIRRSQQLFSDLNRYAKTPSKTLTILFEHREFAAVVAKAWAAQCSAFCDGRTNMETNSLVSKSRHVITLSVLYECVRDLMDKEYAKKVWTDRQQLEAEASALGGRFAEWYDELVTPNLPELVDVINGRVRPVELRSRFVYSHSVGWRAIAITIRRAMDQRHTWKDVVARGVGQIDWRATNPEWEGSAIVAGAIANRRQNIARTAALVSAKFGLDVPEEEADDLLKTMRHYNPAATLPAPLSLAPSA